MARSAVRSVSFVSISLFLCVGFSAFLSGCSRQGKEPVEFDTLWKYSEPGSTEVKFHELLPAAEASGDDSYHLQLLTQIARTQGLQRNFEELGECHLALGHTDEARSYFAKAFEELSQDPWMVENDAERLARLKSLGGLE